MYGMIVTSLALIIVIVMILTTVLQPTSYGPKPAVAADASADVPCEEGDVGRPFKVLVRQQVDPEALDPADRYTELEWSILGTSHDLFVNRPMHAGPTCDSPVIAGLSCSLIRGSYSENDVLVRVAHDVPRNTRAYCLYRESPRGARWATELIW